MTTFQLCVICLTVLVALLIVATAVQRPETPLAPDACDIPLEVAAAVHLTSGVSLRGRVVASGPTVRLADAAALTGGNAQDLGGVAVVPAGAIDWYQEL